MNVLCFGSMNIDKVYSLPHFVKAGETVSAVSYKENCGGKGLNQSIALSKAGVTTYHAGICGKDGKMLLSELSKNGVNTSFVKTDSSNVSGQAIIQIDKQGQNCIIVYGGTNRTITEDYIDSVLSHFDAGDMILLQNEINMLDVIITKAKQKQMTVVLNPSPIDENLLKLQLSTVDVFVINETEGAALSGCTDENDIINALHKKYKNAKIMLTLGEKGSIYFDKAPHFQPAIAVKAVDTTAAGDTFTGYFLAKLCSGCSVEEMLKTAATAASIAVSRAGAAKSIPTADEVAQALQK